MTGFQFDTSFDEETHKVLSSAVKFNNGFFKSLKQSTFLLIQKPLSLSWFSPFAKADVNMTADEAEAKASEYFGIVFDSRSQAVIMSKGSMRWTNYGVKSFRPITWVWVVDRFGVVAQYKLKYKGDTRNGTSVDPEKTETLWKRDASLALPFVLEEKVEEKEPTKFVVAQVGERKEFTATVIGKREFEGTPMFYGDSGRRVLTTLKTENNEVLVYWNSLGEKGDVVTFKATVKGFNDYKGTKQTILSRAKLLSVF